MKINLSNFFVIIFFGGSFLASNLNGMGSSYIEHVINSNPRINVERGFDPEVYFPANLTISDLFFKNRGKFESEFKIHNAVVKVSHVLYEGYADYDICIRFLVTVRLFLETGECFYSINVEKRQKSDTLRSAAILNEKLPLDGRESVIDMILIDCVKRVPSIIDDIVHDFAQHR